MLKAIAEGDLESLCKLSVQHTKPAREVYETTQGLAQVTLDPDIVAALFVQCCAKEGLLGSRIA